MFLKLLGYPTITIKIHIDFNNIFKKFIPYFDKDFLYHVFLSTKEITELFN